MNIKRYLSICLAALLLVTGLTACKSGKTGSSSAKSGGDDVFSIGIVQLTKHDALDSAYEGFVAALDAAGYSEEKGNLKIDYQVATGKADECVTICNQFVADKVDLILAIATDAAQAALNATSDIPILVTAVTNPEADVPGENVSGTSDMGPIEDQIAFAKELCPELKTLGILYNSSEQNSKFQAEKAIEAAQSLGIGYKEFTVTASTELQSVVESMNGQVEACWLPTDNTCASNMDIIGATAQDAHVMTICGEAGMVNSGGLATYGAVDYYKLGEQTGDMAVRIIEGASVSDMPIEYQSAGEDAKIVINREAAESFEIPQSVLDKATFAE